MDPTTGALHARSDSAARAPEVPTAGGDAADIPSETAPAGSPGALDAAASTPSRALERAPRHPWPSDGAAVGLAAAALLAGAVGAALGRSRGVALAALLLLLAPGIEGAAHALFHVAGLSHQDALAVGPSAVSLPATDGPPAPVSAPPPSAASAAPGCSAQPHERPATAPRGARAPPRLPA